MPRRPAQPKNPFWHRSRLGWVNSLGFALSIVYAGWLLLALFRTMMPRSDALQFTIPTIYMVVVLLALLTNVVFCGLVLSHAWRGADFHEHGPRMHVLLWSISGVAFFLLNVLVLVKFGNEPIPNVAPWASTMFWRGALIGLPAFGLMTYVNAHDTAATDVDHDLEEAYDEV